VIVHALSNVLPRLLRDLGLERGVQGWRAVAIWPEVVGESLARRTRATSFRDGTLWVEVEGSAWLHELGFLKRELVRRLNQRLESRQVRDLHFINARGGTLR